MPRVSRADALERRMIEMLEAKAFDASLPVYAQVKAASTLTSLIRRRDKRTSEKQAAARARKAERDKAERVYPNVLPSNGREPLVVPVAAPAFDLAAFLDKQDINRG
jgi:hypothetical protein